MELEYMIIAALAVALITTIVILLSGKNGITDSRLEAMERRLAEQRAEMETRLERRAEEERAETEARLERRSEELNRRYALEFQRLAADSLSHQQSLLRDDNHRELDALLSPLRERIKEFQESIRKTYMSENSSREALARTLTAQIATLSRANAEIGMETRRLADALKGNTRMQGSWGETVLQRLLESGGLKENVHFLVQATRIDGITLRGEEGNALRPDIIILLPGDHRLVIDAKTSMTSYLRYAEADTESERDAALRRHVVSTRAHIDELGTKQYHRHIPGAMEHTLMFMPNDTSYLAALNGDAGICAYAMTRNVTIVSPAHLMSVIQLISQLWRIELQNQNADSIAKEAGKMYDKFVGFISDMESMGRGLRKAQTAYEKCRVGLSEGKGNLVSRAEKLRAMGAMTAKRLSPDVLSSAGESGREEEEAD